MVSSFFSVDYVKSLEPKIQKTADELLDKILATHWKGPVDLVQEFALPLPSHAS